MKILVIAAHPDDEVYGMGGTIAKLSAQGNDVYVLIVTEGCSTQYKDADYMIDRKKKEALRANNILGVKKVIFGELPDMKLDTIPHIQINEVIEKVVEYLKPEVIYTHYSGDVNKDHKLVFESTVVAVRPFVGQSVKRVLSYRVPSSTEWGKNDFKPNVFVEVEEYYDKKEKAILAYESELRKSPHPRCIETVNIYDNYLGRTVGYKRTESFIVYKSLE